MASLSSRLTNEPQNGEVSIFCCLARFGLSGRCARRSQFIAARLIIASVFTSEGPRCIIDINSLPIRTTFDLLGMNNVQHLLSLSHRPRMRNKDRGAMNCNDTHLSEGLTSCVIGVNKSIGRSLTLRGIEDLCWEREEERDEEEGVKSFF